jgi:hypothetical protein
VVANILPEEGPNGKPWAIDPSLLADAGDSEYDEGS